MRTHVLHNWISAFTPKKETFKGEVCIDDLFRYLSALLASVDLWGIDSNMMIQLSSDFFMAFHVIRNYYCYWKAHKKGQ